MNKDNKTGNCNICGEETDLYCHSCSETWGEFNPTWYCEKHYHTTVLTGNCCRGNELLYENNN